MQVTKIIIVIAAALVLPLAGCASQSSLTNYTRTDGRADESRLRTTLAQCQGEGAGTTVDYPVWGGLGGYIDGAITRSQRETAITNACMARNGYLAQQ